MVTLFRNSISSTIRSFARWIPPITFRRGFGSSAAAEIAYDSEWDDDDRFSRRSPKMPPFLAENSWGKMKERSVQWVFMGNPSSQKREYATRIAQLLEVPYISMGTLVRQELHPSSSLYIKIANAVNEGRLVTEDIIFDLLSKRLEESYSKGESGFILDGIPRTLDQAEILDQIEEIDLVVNFKSSEDSLEKKHAGNDICSRCGKIYDIFNSQSTRLNPCVATSTSHSKLNAFDGDNSPSEKMRLYSEQSKLLEDYYRQQDKLLDFQAVGGPGETWRGLLAALHLQQTHALHLQQTHQASRFSHKSTV